MVHQILLDITQNLTNSNPGINFFSDFIPSKDAQNTDFGVYVTLLNINEDTSTKIPYSYKKTNEIYQTQNPSLHLDLFIMISAYKKPYDESLKLIDKVIQTFVNTYHFSIAGSSIEYSLQMVNLSMEQNNNLWQALSNNILPHVIYKVRSLIIDSQVSNGAYRPVSEIELNTVLIK